MMLLKDLIEQAHSNSKAKGWWDGVALPLISLELVPEKLALIHSEISEALECFRDGEMDLQFVVGAAGSLKPVGFPSELADVVIRCADLLGALKDPLWKGVVRDLRRKRRVWRALEQVAYEAGRVVRHRLEDAATGLDRATTADARWRQLLCGVVLRHTGPWKTIRGGIVCPKCGAKFVWAKPAMAKNLDGVALIAAERRRQIEEEGWSMAHDASCHDGGQLVHAAIAYLARVVGRVELSNNHQGATGDRGTPGLGGSRLRRDDADGIQDRQGAAAGITWVIVGGESGAHARPFDLAWARSLRDQCAATGTAFFMKQMGARPMVDEERWRADGQHIRAGDRPTARACADSDLLQLDLRDRAGADPDEWPADLRVQQFPEVRHG